MQTLTQCMLLVFRVCLSATLMIEAVCVLLPNWVNTYVPTVATGIEDQFYQNVAFGTLYFIISIWLLFGIKTNVMAALGGILLVLPAMVIPEIGGADLATKLALSAVFAFPLSIFGGGRYSVYDRGWREAF